MRRMLFSWLLLFLVPTCVFAGIGDTDNRFYVDDNMWAQHPYNKFVQLFTKYSNYIEGCTAQYVSKNLILSAAHCIRDGATYEIRNYKKEHAQVSLVYNGRLNSATGLGDWAVWRIDDSQYYADDFFDVSVLSKSSPVINAGWGTMKIFTDSELQEIKKMIMQVKQEGTVKNESVLEQVEERLKAQGENPLKDDSSNLKASKCNVIVNDDCSANNATTNKICENKIVHREKYPNILGATCNTWSGNSGGGYVAQAGKNLYGVHSASVQNFGKDSAAFLTSAYQFKDKLAELIKNNPATVAAPVVTNAAATISPAQNSEPKQLVVATGTGDATNPSDNQNITPAQNTANKDGNQDVPAQDTMAEIPSDEIPDDIEQQINDQEQKVKDLGNALDDGVQNVDDNTSMADILNLLATKVQHDIETTKLDKLKKAYEEAKSNEQSSANKTLTALTTAATGIGGMQLMQGLAEQSADKDAEEDMTAYIETMRCTYGDGKQVKAGTDEIELPGANDETLMKLRAEYIALAADLKERKQALGMKPGIEGEEILDRATSGLYDDEFIGIEKGTYASLYRAQMLQSEADQTKIDDAASKSKKRVIGGAIAAGAGVVVGVVGNSLINGKLGEALKKKKNAKEENTALEKLKQCLKDGGATNTKELKFQKFMPSILHLENISCKGQDWSDRVKNKNATGLFADTTDANVITETLTDNFGCVITGKLLDVDLDEKCDSVDNNKTPIVTGPTEINNVQPVQINAQNITPAPVTSPTPSPVTPTVVPPVEAPQQDTIQNKEKEQVKEAPEVPVVPLVVENPDDGKVEQEQENKEKQQKNPPAQKKQQAKPVAKDETKTAVTQVVAPAPAQQQKAKQKSGNKTKTNLTVFKDVQVNLEQGKKLIELWGKKNNKKNFNYVAKSEEINTFGQDFISYQDDNHIYTFEFDDLSESIQKTRKEGVGSAVCIIHKGTPNIGSNFVQCDNVKCSDFMRDAKNIDTSIKEWTAPNVPYGQKQTSTSCRISTTSPLINSK